MTATIEHPTGAGAPTDAPVLRLEDLSVRFGGVAALEAVSFGVRPGEILGVIGPNGAGKTTLLNVVSGFVRPSRGEVRLGDVALLRRRAPDRARLGVGRTFQTPQLFEGMTVRENLAVTGRQHRRGAEYLQTVEEVAEFVEITDLLEVPVSRLTAGGRRFAEVARALMLRPLVLLLDEPATGLHDSEVVQIGAIIRRLSEQHTIAALLISHNMDIVNDSCSKVVAIDGGQVLATGTPAEIRRHPEVVHAYFGTEEVAAGKDGGT
jgi:ABC-type branched-subunit amino acid transport system ATPase component